MKKFFQGIGINIILLGIVSLITDISSEMMQAILPMFIVSLGGAGIAVGLISGVGDSLASILKVFSGYWSDKLRKRKPFVFWGYLTSSVAKLLFPLSSRWVQMLLFRPIERVGKGLRTAPRDALIASSSAENVRGKAFGFHRAADTAGAIIGAGLAFIFYWVLKFGFKSILLISAIVAFLALIPLFWVKEKSPVQGFLPRPAGGVFFSLKGLPKNFKKYLIAATIFALANFTYMFFVLKAKTTFDGFFSAELATAIPILLYMWFNIVYASAALPGGILSDKIGRRKILFGGYIVYACTCLGFAWLNSLGSFIILFAVYGISFALVEGNQRAFAADFVAEPLRGTALGVFHTAISLAALPAGIIAGVLWNYNTQVPFVYGAVLAIIASFLMGTVQLKARTQ